MNTPRKVYLASDGTPHEHLDDLRYYEVTVDFARRLREELPGRVAPDVVRWLLRNYQLLPKQKEL